MSARRDDPGLQAAVPFAFGCSRCGHCCSGGNGHVWLEPGEVERLAAALGATPAGCAALHVRTAVDPRTNAARQALRERADGRCTLLDGRNTCTAYDARPAHCRTFPHWPAVLAGGAAFAAARDTCPGIAVVAPESLRQRAFAALEALYARLEARAPPVVDGATCCLDADSAEDVYVSALEADHAAARGRPARGCRLGPAQPLGCRVARCAANDPERWREELRGIERELDYPAAYGEARALLGARGVVLEERAP